ncbi:hypothetical protein VIGAN_04203300 [Vigna angularis var. angularis]|uniref:Uncharacterized protein n=1 Tax=Vigna angularis var. angularis TaxID=157739 RepID=A0A0S3RVK5_PHAAN|nr:hypothetical protein VIGAN_04203300 [Vigna angularis var. angularis]
MLSSTIPILTDGMVDKKEMALSTDSSVIVQQMQMLPTSTLVDILSSSFSGMLLKLLSIVSNASLGSVCCCKI